MTFPNLALIGCGAVARALYLPALATHRAAFDRVWLVDPSEHARSLAATTVAGRQVEYLSDIDEDIHIAIVATANHLHFRLAQEALSRGADVLIEKPFVIWPEEGRTLVRTAAALNRLVAVNQTRRFFPIARELRGRIRRGDFGILKSITHKEGNKLVWPYESGAAFARGAERTGVVMDIGVHVIDIYEYLLGPRWTFVSATHDGFNGPEGLAVIELRADDVPVSIRLSRYYAQENVARMIFEHGEISFNVYDSGGYTIRSTTTKSRHVAVPGASADYRRYGEPLLLNFLAARDQREPVACGADSSLPVIDILDAIYRQARRYPTALGAV